MEISLWWGKDLLTKDNPIIYREDINKKIDVDIAEWPKVDKDVRCYIKYNRQTREYSKVCENVASRYKKYFNVVIVLESPHRNEFDDEFNPKEPLSGASGTKFDNNILDKIDKWFTNVKFDKNVVFKLWLINPVPYQTSLYHLLNNKIPNKPIIELKDINYDKDDNIRNRVWDVLYYGANCEAEFIKALESCKPDYIVNCSTKDIIEYDLVTKFTALPVSSVNVKPIKLKVRETISKFKHMLKEDCSYLEDGHPFSWDFKK